MIVKTRFSMTSMWPYARFELALGAAAALLAWMLVALLGLRQLALPVTLATVLGTALSILLAVRVNTAYQRWWEASGCWAQLVGASRNLVRVAVTVTDAKDAAPALTAAFQSDIARRQTAFLVALRLQLRGRMTTAPGRAELDARLDDADRAAVTDPDGRPGEDAATLLLERQSGRILAAFREGLLTGLDNFQMEAALATAAIQQALAERIAQQPVPRTYDIFSRYLMHLYTVVFPFAVIGALSRDQWLVVPATLIVAFAFRILERIGAVVEAPFANTAQDVPLTALTTIAERSMLALTGAQPRPATPQPIGGHLW